MRSQLKDIENRINTESKGKKKDGNKSYVELGSNSLRILPKLNNSFL